nr:hypothetical protein [uncultured Mediterranean phage uvMED]
MSRTYESDRPIDLDEIASIENFDILWEDSEGEPAKLIRRLETDEELVQELTSIKSQGMLKHLTGNPPYDFGHFRMNDSSRIIQIQFFGTNCEARVLPEISEACDVNFEFIC